MESTGKYYIPVYNVLESHISNIFVANPKWVRAVKGEKDDDKDAKWIADLFNLVLLEVVLYLKKISASFANSLATSTNL